MEGSETIAQATVTRLQSGRRTRAEDARALTFPVIVSTALHGLAALVIAMLAAGGARVDVPPPRSVIQATLVSPAPRFVVSEPEPSTPPVREPQIRPPAKPALVPVPPMPRTAPRPETASQGQVIIGVLGTGEAVEGALEAVLAQLYPGAVRTEAEFEIPPTGVYPKGALADRRQFQINVAVIVHEDGRVELAQGTFDDTLFAPAIREALASAKARPRESNGQATTSWSLVSFTFEYVGSR